MPWNTCIAYMRVLMHILVLKSCNCPRCISHVGRCKNSRSWVKPTHRGAEQIVCLLFPLFSNYAALKDGGYPLSVLTLRWQEWTALLFMQSTSKSGAAKISAPSTIFSRWMSVMCTSWRALLCYGVWKYLQHFAAGFFTIFGRIQNFLQGTWRGISPTATIRLKTS